MAADYWSTINHNKTQLTEVTSKSIKTSATFYNQCNNIAKVTFINKIGLCNKSSTQGEFK